MDNFIVSARKYRPATFASVVGQEHITSTLRHAIQRGQLAHAYLFCGPRGVGKTTCARIFAKAINCLDPQEGAEACGHCESCLSFAEGRSFNIHELDAASNNSVDDIRSLTEQVRIPPQVGRYSVYIIDEVHMLSQAAFNAFLKTLEEPPAHAIFILATTEKHKILPTILSRCQIYDFNRIRVEDAVGYLRRIADREGIATDDESLHLIARKADGGMRDALSMFDKAVSFCGGDLHYHEVAATLDVLDYDTYFDVVDALAAGDYAKALLRFDEVLRNGFSGQTFMAGLAGHLRDLLMTKLPATAPLLEVSGSLLDRYRAQGARLEPRWLFDAIALLDALDGSLRTATNQRLHVELGLMKLCGAVRHDPSPAAMPLPPTGKGTTSAPATTPPASHPVPAPSSASAPSSAPSAGTPAAIDVPSRQTVEPPVPYPVQTPVAGSMPSPEPVRPPVESSGTTSEPPRPTLAPVPPTTPLPVPQAAAEPAPRNRRPLSGTPIAEILRSAGTSVDTASENDRPAAIDPLSETKIAEAREDFLRRIRNERPRFAEAFGGMTVSGNTLTVVVPSELLREEILRNRAEILSLLAELADVNGGLELQVNVAEQQQVYRPIKVEDKLRYLTDLNPAVTELRRALDLEIE